MKVLWFAMYPCSAIEKLEPSSHLGGWLKLLENELIKFDNVILSVSFYWHEKIEPFQYNNIYYYPVFRDDGTKFLR